jgi:hypothetical protein
MGMHYIQGCDRASSAKTSHSYSLCYISSADARWRCHRRNRKPGKPAGMFVRYIDFTHESGFTENSLRQILRAVGFSDIVITGNAPGIYSWRSYFRIAVQRLWHQCLRVMYSLDRGWSAAPKVLSPLLIAHAIRPRHSTTQSVG